LLAAMELFSASSPVRSVLQSHIELVDASVPIDSLRGVPSRVERFLEIESTSLDQMASLVGSIKLKKKVAKIVRALHHEDGLSSRETRCPRLGSLAALARRGGDHHAPPQVQSVDCLFLWSQGGSIQSASPATIHAKSPPKTLLAGPIAVKKKSIRPCTHEDGDRLSSSECSPAPGNLWYDSQQEGKLHCIGTWIGTGLHRFA
jgi:hypothetical protein